MSKPYILLFPTRSSKQIGSKVLLAQALADESLSLVALDKEYPTSTFIHLIKFLTSCRKQATLSPITKGKRAHEGEDSLCLSLEWNNRRQDNPNTQITTSYSDGYHPPLPPLPMLSFILFCLPSSCSASLHFLTPLL